MALETLVSYGGIGFLVLIFLTCTIGMTKLHEKQRRQEKRDQVRDERREVEYKERDQFDALRRFRLLSAEYFIKSPEDRALINNARWGRYWWADETKRSEIRNDLEIAFISGYKAVVNSTTATIFTRAREFAQCVFEGSNHDDHNSSHE